MWIFLIARKEDKIQLKNNTGKRLSLLRDLENSRTS